MGAERRRFERIDERLLVKFRLKGASEFGGSGQTYTTYTRNITDGGIMMELPEGSIGEGTNVALDNFLLFRSVLEFEIFLPPSQTPIHALGTTVWIEKHPGGPSGERGVGIQFKDLAEEYRRAIVEFIQSRRAPAFDQAGSD